jgi:very-short-patch-repair endonuclease
MPHTPVGETRRNRAEHLLLVMNNLEGVSTIGLAAEQAAPPSLTLPRKGGGNTSIDGPARDEKAASVGDIWFDASVFVLPPPLRGRVGEGGMPHTPVDDVQRARARQLRREMTRAETLLWRHLKAHRLVAPGFRRQAPMGNYIADFVSHSCKLVIEVDGESHDFESRLRHDERRDQWFASRGYRVLRFTNDDVMKNLEGVVMAIGLAAEQASPPSLTLPRKGGGNISADGARRKARAAK